MTKFNKLEQSADWLQYFEKYPRGYTILENLIDWLSQVNIMVENVNNWNDYLEDFVQCFDQELQQNVIDTLAEWQADGTLDIVIDQALQTQMDTLEQDTQDKLNTFESQLAQNTTDIESLDSNSFKKEDVVYIDIRDFGAGNPLNVDDSIPIQNAMNEAGTKTFGTVVIPDGTYVIENIIVPKNIKIQGNGKLKLKQVGSKGLIFDNVRMVNIQDIEIRVTADNQIALEYKNGTKEIGLLNVNVVSEGDYVGTVSVSLTSSWINTFTNCLFLETAKGIVFNIGAHRNAFVGCSVRTFNEPTSNSVCLIEHNAGTGNSFIGCDIENAKEHIRMNGGMLSLIGNYLEVQSATYGITLNGGNLNLTDNYMLNVFTAINGEGSLHVSGNTFDGTQSNANFPFIRYISDNKCNLKLMGNNVTNAEACIFRTSQWDDGPGWSSLTALNYTIIESGNISPGNSTLQSYYYNQVDDSYVGKKISMKGGKSITYATSPPTSGYNSTGHMILNPTPTTHIGWVCTQSGSPGTWKRFGVIEA